jgi:hypothetical protein
VLPLALQHQASSAAAAVQARQISSHTLPGQQPADSAQRRQQQQQQHPQLLLLLLLQLVSRILS